MYFPRNNYGSKSNVNQIALAPNPNALAHSNDTFVSYLSACLSPFRQVFVPSPPSNFPPSPLNLFLFFISVSMPSPIPPVSQPLSLTLLPFYDSVPLFLQNRARHISLTANVLPAPFCPIRFHSLLCSRFFPFVPLYTKSDRVSVKESHPPTHHVMYN